MTGFSAEWLALRETADLVARSKTVLDAAHQYVATSIRSPLKICDLGSGTGASVAAFSNLFPKPQRWQLFDYDASNLERAGKRFSGAVAKSGVEIITCEHDLAIDPAPWQTDTHIVTASALFDLTSVAWLTTFTNYLAADRLPLLATLTYDSRHVFAPELPLDATMVEAFNTHQKRDKGFGPAAGPGATAHLLERLHDHDYATLTEDSSWHLDGERDAQMIAALLDGWAEAVIEADLVPEQQVRNWHEARIDSTAAMQVGHLDLFAAPRT